jgi:uncharacterized lipoprotein YddW (UPF0748 family)
MKMEITSPRSTPLLLLLATVAVSFFLSSRGEAFERASIPEVRGTWITTTANDAIATPDKTAQTMRRLAEIGINTVYVETWKNGYTQFPSKVLERTIGVSQRPASASQDPSEAAPKPARDLLNETLIEAHRNGLIYVAWFEYGFMAAHQSTMNHLRRMKPEWLSRDINGSEVAKNGFVWMNPLHPEAREFLLDIVLEAIDKYDLDGVQLDDRIVWPHVTMGYDDYTKKIYASEHQGAAPPSDHTDPAWMRWRADKVNEFARWFTQEIRAKRPGLIVSLSPAVYPWSWENYLLDWPKWAAWRSEDAIRNMPFRSPNASATKPQWDEFVPQAYRFSYAAFDKTWREQNDAFLAAAPERKADLIAGIRLVGEGKDSSWAQLRDSIVLARTMGNGGHVHWFSRGVLDVFPNELKNFYSTSGRAHHPLFPSNWRNKAVTGKMGKSSKGNVRWAFRATPGSYRVIGFDGSKGLELQSLNIEGKPLRNIPHRSKTFFVSLSSYIGHAELLLDRRGDMRDVPACRKTRPCQ